MTMTSSSPLAADRFSAVGVGAYFALGALAVATGTPVNRLTLALRAAGRFAIGVAGPYIIRSTHPDQCLMEVL